MAYITGSTITSPSIDFLILDLCIDCILLASSFTKLFHALEHIHFCIEFYLYHLTINKNLIPILTSNL